MLSKNPITTIRMMQRNNKEAIIVINNANNSNTNNNKNNINNHNKSRNLDASTLTSPKSRNVYSMTRIKAKSLLNQKMTSLFLWTAPWWAKTLILRWPKQKTKNFKENRRKSLKHSLTSPGTRESKNRNRLTAKRKMVCQAGKRSRMVTRRIMTRTVIIVITTPIIIITTFHLIKFKRPAIGSSNLLKSRMRLYETN